jgi:hypothetical protein
MPQGILDPVRQHSGSLVGRAAECRDFELALERRLLAEFAVKAGERGPSS